MSASEAAPGRQRKRRLARTDGLCEMCLTQGRTLLATEVDHITPLALGGMTPKE